MTNLKHLLNIWILEFFGINKAFHQKNKTKFVFMVLGGILLSLLFLGMSFGYSFGIAIVLKPFNQLKLLPIIMMVLTCLITLFATLYKANSVLFSFQDYDMIMSLPIKTTTIVASRIWLLYIMNVLFAMIVMIPSGIVYAIFESPSIWFYPIYLITLFLIPFIPIILATFVSGILTFFTARLKRANAVSTILTLAILVGIMAFLYNPNMKNVDFSSIATQVTNSLYSIYPLTKLYMLSITEYNLFSLFLFIAISCLAFLLFVVLFSKIYQPIHTLLYTSKANANYKLAELKQESPLKALYFKECKRYFSSTLYVVNTSLGMILALLACVAVSFVGVDKLNESLQIPNLPLYFAQFSPFVISVFVALSCTTNCSISLEGKNLWIIKSSPVPISTIFWSKIAVNLTITIPVILISATVLSVSFSFNWFQVFMTYLLPAIYAFLISLLGLIVNLHLPLLDWKSEVTVIKQSSSVLVSLIVGFLILAAPIGIAVYLYPYGSIMTFGIISLLLVLITILCYRYLMTKGVKQFQRL
ncbi:hypothetical protein RBG61_07035 [Paludicola sp. MB14-C6]|uniref:hypothetical protein n=1 Tax=Paludihabitans sp. MB14-C6 TaxID=3070656 RepID=UPI0027DDC7D3|nr:hypothetical protein [Paludicola sp. MB14-C6]WMJ24413.1 hypothetical protein RBG61_07035 [Paludicola sp. MB14-C6]